MQKGDTIELGKYVQTADDKICPIKWRVLDVIGNKVLVVSKYALDCLLYNTNFEPINWKDCTLRYGYYNFWNNSLRCASVRGVSSGVRPAMVINFK